MVFSSLEFVFFFLPLSLLAYFVAPRVLKNSVLLLASLLFYLWGAGSFVLVLLLSIGLNYCFGLLAEQSLSNPERAAWRKPALIASVLTNVGLLAYFKYANFFVDEINRTLAVFGHAELNWVAVVLPIGISFFTFQSMSYVFDIARGESKALKNPIDFALYVALFPQLIAGPIVRYKLIETQLRQRKSDVEALAEGGSRFIYGLCKKVIVADPAGAIAHIAFSTPASDMTSATAWLGAIAYTVQIYFDFSAYSDMAIGIGRMLGFRFPENFHNPYTALSITDFWRRWHITLSNWFRDYVYIPLGGSRGSEGRTYFNLSMIFLLTGIWHGANWTFIVWGAYHGALLIIERVTDQRVTSADHQVFLRRAITLFLVIIGWVIFRADNIDQAFNFYWHMFVWNELAVGDELRQALYGREMLVTALACLIVFLPRDWSGFRWLTAAIWSPKTSEQSWLASGRTCVFLALAVPYAIILLSASTFSPFLYFRF